MHQQAPTHDCPGSAPMPEGLPHVGCILLWYPLFTQPFIFRDVEALKRRLPVTVFSLYGRNLKHCSEEMAEAAPSVRTMGIKALPAMLASWAKLFLTRPLVAARAFRTCLFHRWTSWETFGEDIWSHVAAVHLAPRFVEAGIDVIYAPWPRGTATAARTISLLTGIPYATSARGDNLNPPDPDLKDKLQHALFIRANNQADARRIAALAGPEAGSRTRLVYNSLTLRVDGLAPLPFAKPCRILAVGRFDVTKGFDVLMQACGLLKRQGRDFRLTLAGGGGRAMGLGAMTETILGLRKSLGLEAVVDLPGIVGHDRLPAIIKAHDIFTAPCVVHESGRRDGIPNTIIEAMSFGLPVVATSTNALPEAVHDGETGLLVEQKDPKALADALAWLMDHPDEARAMGRAGARLAREMFSPEENGDRLAQLFIDALSGAPSPSSDSRGGACAE